MTKNIKEELFLGSVILRTRKEDGSEEYQVEQWVIQARTPVLAKRELNARYLHFKNHLYTRVMFKDVRGLVWPSEMVHLDPSFFSKSSFKLHTFESDSYTNAA